MPYISMKQNWFYRIFHQSLLPWICIWTILSVGLGWDLHTQAPDRLSGVFVFLIASFSLLPFIIHSTKKAILRILVVGCFARSIETIGLRTCFPYGCFSYLQGIGTSSTRAPRTVFFAWPPLVLGTYVLISRIPSTLQRILLGITILLMFDAVFDPGAVHVWFWEYSAGGRYYQVPRSNFLGWILSGSIGLILTQLILHPSHTITTKADASHVLPQSYIRSLACMLGFWTAYARWSSLLIPGVVWTLGICLLLYRTYDIMTRNA